jgi:hypothetical protein
MEPTGPHRQSGSRPVSRPTSRIDDYRVSPAAEPKSWATPPRVAEQDWAWQAPAPAPGSVFTHNADHFRAVAAPQPAEEVVDVEPALPATPRWMIAVAGAAVAALMGALLGGFMHV